MKISIIFHSETGHTEKMADMIREGLESVPDTEVRYFPLNDEENWDTDFLAESRAVLFGTPVYYANMCWQMKKWFDTKGAKYKLGGKIGSAFATENSPFGGSGELAIMSIYNHILVYGMLVYSSGSEYGMPPIHIGPTAAAGNLASCRDRCIRYGRQISTKVHELFD